MGVDKRCAASQGMAVKVQGRAIGRLDGASRLLEMPERVWVSQCRRVVGSCSSGRMRSPAHSFLCVKETNREGETAARRRGKKASTPREPTDWGRRVRGCVKRAARPSPTRTDHPGPEEPHLQRRSASRSMSRGGSSVCARAGAQVGTRRERSRTRIPPKPSNVALPV